MSEERHDDDEKLNDRQAIESLSKIGTFCLASLHTARTRMATLTICWDALLCITGAMAAQVLDRGAASLRMARCLLLVLRIASVVPRHSDKLKDKLRTSTSTCEEQAQEEAPSLVVTFVGGCVMC